MISHRQANHFEEELLANVRDHPVTDIAQQVTLEVRKKTFQDRSAQDSDGEPGQQRPVLFQQDFVKEWAY